MSNVLLEIKDHIAVITLNRPESLNALTVEMAEQLKETLLTIQNDETVRAVILTGAGKGFCSGADLKMLDGNTIEDAETGRYFMREVQKVGSFLYHFPLPVIAAVNGVCVGGGFSLALLCDYIISAKSATYSMIFPKVGLVPDIGSMYTLPRLIGLPKAKRLMFTGKMLTAEEALELGIVEEVVDDEKLIDVCMKEAETIANLAPRSIRYAKETVNETYDMTLETLFVKEAYQQAALFKTRDFLEAAAAFVQKRSPVFTGK